MGLFNKSADPNSPEFKAISDRWDGFLKKLEGRYNEIMEQAKMGLEGLISGLQYDSVAIHNVCNGLKNQTVTQLTEKVDQGWDKMYAEMNKINADSSDVRALSDKGAMLKIWMEVDFAKFEVKAFADAARKILENVKAHIKEDKMHLCTQCANELPIKVYSFNAINLKCDSCGSVNTYQPDDRVRALEYYVINHLAEEEAFDLKMKSRTDKNMAKEYYRKYYGYLMENVPDKAEFYKRDMDERVGWVDNKPGYYTDLFRL